MGEYLSKIGTQATEHNLYTPHINGDYVDSNPRVGWC